MKLHQVPTHAIERIEELLRDERERRLNIAIDRMIDAELARMHEAKKAINKYRAMGAR